MLSIKMLTNSYQVWLATGAVAASATALILISSHVYDCGWYEVCAIPTLKWTFSAVGSLFAFSCFVYGLTLHENAGRPPISQWLGAFHMFGLLGANLFLLSMWKIIFP